MKSLSLYVDKWFITVAVNIDGNVIPLSLPNGEDRVWLFFHEDTANSRVLYGKSFENNYRDKELHYIGDIFPLIETDEHHFTRYDNRPEEMKEIFKVSNIFSHLREAVQEDGTIDTYISFSADISDIARLKFIKELEEAKFNVVVSVARISHLALEESRKRGVFTEDGMYLVLVATNDNLHYSLYQLTENLFVRKKESELPGMGIDVRERALIETVVENINRTTRFLSTPEEYALEYKRQERFAGEWLSQIQNRKYNLPGTLSNITFAVAPNNPYPVTVKATDLDQRTEGLVDDIVRKIADFVKANNVLPHEIKGIAFIGNTFTNSKFSAAINARFIVPVGELVSYRETELPKVVSIYSQIDCAQFSEATDKFVKNATTQAELNQQAREEEERRKAAEAEARRQQEERDQKLKADKEYSNAIENVERFESDADYENMIDWANIALTHHPDDEYAKEKLSYAQQLLAEQRANKKQFDTILQRVKTAFKEGRWNDAISQSDIALELRPDSDEVKRIKKESKRQLDIKEKVSNYLNRADMFFAQKLYSEALAEVGKVLNLDPSNAEAKEIQSKISSVNSEHERKINTLVSQLNELEANKEFVSAIKVCDTLIDEDANNVGKWTSKKERLISRQRELEENKRNLAQLKNEINQAHFDEDWATLKVLCERYLNTSDDADVSRFLTKAKKRLEEHKVKESKEKALALINGLIVDRKFNEAKAEIDRFAQKYPSEHSVVKDLRSKVFSFDSDSTPNSTSTPNPPRKPVGFNPGGKPPVGTDGEDDFFGTPTPKKPTHTQRGTEQTKRAAQSKPKHDEFFDSASQVGIAPLGKKITNDDFNF